MVLSRLVCFAKLVEWHEAEPRQAPHTFQVVLPMVLQDGTAPDGDRATGDFAEAIRRYARLHARSPKRRIDNLHRRAREGPGRCGEAWHDAADGSERRLPI